MIEEREGDKYIRIRIKDGSGEEWVWLKLRVIDGERKRRKEGLEEVWEEREGRHYPWCKQCH